MAILDQRRFGDDVFDLSEVVALVGRAVYLRDGRKVGVGVATADALRAAIAPARALPRDILGKGKDTKPGNKGVTAK